MASNDYKRDNCRHIYENLREEVNNLFDSLSSVTTDDKAINTANKEAVTILSECRESINDECIALDKNAEWDKFTVAFYGETNAGKSTIIEALRLYFAEATKVETQKKFKELQQKNGISQEDFDKIHETIVNTDKVLCSLKSEIAQSFEDEKADALLHETKIEELKKVVEQEAANRNWWQKFIHLFKKTKADLELREYISALESISKEYKNKRSNLQREIDKNQKLLNTATANETKMSEKCKVLEDFADGKIIGTGISDFTQKNVNYTLNINDEDIRVIDVPGIEGKEGAVIASIMQAVQKAHTVFYVTRKPAAPQTGDGQEGTLEKIKKHLGSQTEIWTIFNQPINNARQLESDLVDEDDKKSLANMNKELKDRLGSSHYQGEIILSAYPAFLSLADCTVPGSKNAQSKRNFEKRYPKDELCERSQFNAFVEKLRTEIVCDWREKIIASNYNKAVNVIDNTMSRIEEIRVKFDDVSKGCNREYRNSVNQIDSDVSNFKTNLTTAKLSVIQQFVKSSREKIYAKINTDIGNDDFKHELERILNTQQEILQRDFKCRVQNCSEDFQQRILATIKKAIMHMEEILDCADYEIQNIDLKLNIKSGLNTAGLIKSLVGAGFLYFCPYTAPFALVLGVLHCVVQFLKSVYGFFNHSYRREQQCKAANDNISNSEKQITIGIEDALRKFYPTFNERVNTVKKEIYGSCEVVNGIIYNLRDTAKKLEQMKKTITTGSVK